MAAEVIDRSKQADMFTFVGIAKLFTAQSTVFTGEISNGKVNYELEQAVKYVDKFIKSVEKAVQRECPEHIETLEILDVELNNGITNLKQQLTTNINQSNHE